MAIFSLDIHYCFQHFNSAHKQIVQKIWGTEVLPGQHINQVISVSKDLLSIQENLDQALSGTEFTASEELGASNLARHHYENHYCPIIANEQVDGNG